MFKQLTQQDNFKAIRYQDGSFNIRDIKSDGLDIKRWLESKVELTLNLFVSNHFQNKVIDFKQFQKTQGRAPHIKRVFDVQNIGSFFYVFASLYVKDERVIDLVMIYRQKPSSWATDEALFESTSTARFAYKASQSPLFTAFRDPQLVEQVTQHFEMEQLS
jgi:hypothetical protein